MFEPDKWTIFAAAIVCAAGTLMGLFVVAISVRLDIATTRRAAATRGAHPAPSHRARLSRGSGADPGPAEPATRARVHPDGGHFRRGAAIARPSRSHPTRLDRSPVSDGA